MFILPFYCNQPLPILSTINMPFQPSRFGLHFEDSSQTFLMTKQILKSSQNCDSCSSPMVQTSCAATKSADLLFGGVDPARRQRTSDLEVSFKAPICHFNVSLSWYSTSHRSRCLYWYLREEPWRVASIPDRAHLFVAPRKCYPTWRSRCQSGDWRKYHVRKYCRGSYREGMWVLPLIQRWVLPGSIPGIS